MKKSRIQNLGILLLIATFIGIIILFGFLILRPQSNHTGRIISPILDIVEKVKVSELPKIFDKHFSEEEDNYAVVIKNLETREAFVHNGDKEFISASLYKLWVLAVVKEQLDEGTLSEDDLLSSEKNILDNRLSVNTPTPKPEGFTPEENKEIEYISYKIGGALEKMITISDNYSAILLSNRVGAGSITDFLEEYELYNSAYSSPPKTTAGDIAKYYEQLYMGEIIDQKISSEMITLLKKQEFDDRIPKYLPEDIEIAHKTGELLGAKHDAGIVFRENGDYIIVVLSQTENEAEAAEKIAEFSRDVFEYFEES